MACLHCGGCRRTTSPLSAPFPCPYVIHKEDYYFCRIYEHSPQLCRDFNFEDYPYCPYGMNELRLSYPEDEEKLRERVEKGARLLNELQHTRKTNRCLPTKNFL